MWFSLLYSFKLKRGLKFGNLNLKIYKKIIKDFFFRFLREKKIREEKIKKTNL